MKKKVKRIMILLASAITIGLVCFITIFLSGKIESIPKGEVSKKCKIEQKKYQDQSVYIVTPKSYKNDNKVILYVHGGSYIGSLTTKYWDFIASICQDTGYTIIVPDYPLTPNYDYEDVFEFMLPLYEKVIHQVKKENLILLGDSAGGGLSLALLEKIGEMEGRMPAQTILISPWLDVRMQNPNIKEVEKNDPILNIVNLKVAGITYAGKNGMDSYLVNPIDGPLEKLENITIYTGTYDVLNPDVSVLVQRAKEKGIDIKVKQTTRAIHNWIIENSEDVEYSKQDYQRLVNELKGVKEN